MRARLLLPVLAAFLGLGLFAWSSLTGGPPDSGGISGVGAPSKGGVGEGRSAVDAALASDGSPSDALAAPLTGEGTLTVGGATDDRMDAAAPGEWISFLRAVEGLDQAPVPVVSIARARALGSALEPTPVLRPGPEPGLFEVRWPRSSGADSIDLTLEAEGLLAVGLGALKAGPVQDAHTVQFMRPSSLAVGIEGYPAAEGTQVQLFLRKDSSRGRVAQEKPWKGEDSVLFEGLPSGHASVVVIAPGHPPGQATSIRLRAGARSSVTISAPRGEQVRGTVVEVGTERPVKGVKVQLRPKVSGLGNSSERAPFGDVVTDVAGRFSFEGAPVGKTEVLLSTEDGARVSRDIVVIEGNGARELKLRVQPPASLSGRVLGQRGEGLELAVVPKSEAGRVLSAAAAGRALAARGGVEVSVGDDGTFSAPSVPAGRQLLLVARRAGSPCLSTVEVKEPLQPGEQRDGVDLALRAPVRRQFQVVDGAGTPIESVVVRFEERLFGSSSWGPRASLQSVSGVFEVDGLLEGARRIAVEAEGYTSLMTGWAEGQVPTLELRGRRDVHVVVLGSHGRGLSRARVTAVVNGLTETKGRKRGGPRQKEGCNRFGRAVLDLDPSFDWELQVSAEGYTAAEPFVVKGTDSVPAAAPRVVRLEPEDEPEYAVVRGEIVRAGSGGPIFDLEFQGLRGGTWSLDGTAFELRGIRPGRVRMSATSGGFETVRLPVESLEAGQELDVGVLRVLPATRLEVAVTDHSGKRVRKLRVRLQRLPAARGGRDDLPRRLDLKEQARRAGTYVISGASRAKWRLTVEQGKRRLHSQNVTLAQARQRIEVRLPRPDGTGR